MKNKNRTKFLILLILFIAIGYAYLSANLSILGIGRFNPSEWGVYFTNSRVTYYDNKTIEHVNNYLEYTDLTDDYATEFEVSAHFLYPGQYYIINVDVENTGTMNAIVNIIDQSGLTNEQLQYIDYEIIYADKQEINQGDLLKGGETDTISIIIKYKDDITEEILAIEDKSATFTIGIEYRAGKGNVREKREAILKDGPTVNSKIKEVAGVSYGEVPGDDTNVQAIKRSYEISDENIDPNNLISANDSDVPVYVWFDNGTIYYYADSYDDIILAPNSSRLFQGFEKCNEIEVGTLDTSNVTNMSLMFENDWYIQSLDTNKFDTGKVTDMSYMFESCYDLIELKLNSFDVSYVETMESMFAMCKSLQSISIDYDIFDTSNVSNMKNMFFNCFVLTDEGMIYPDTSNVTNMSSMFEGMLTITELNLIGIDTRKVTNMSYMFAGCKNLKKIRVGNYFDTSLVSNSTNMFEDCLSLVGGVGTVYDSTHVDKTYARLDGGSSSPGYFSPEVQ